MLTAIGRAAAQRVVLRAAPLTAVPRSQLVVRAVACRGFSTTQWARLAAKASKTTTKAKPKKAAATTKKAAPAKKKAAPAKKPKAAKKKVVKKVVKKAAPKKRVKKVLTPEEQKKLDVRALKKKALLKGQPKTLPYSAFLVYTKQELGGKPLGNTTLAERTEAVSQSYKNLSSYEVQRLQQQADENKLANNAALKAWVESHTPNEVYEANWARLRLRQVGGKKKPVPIQDDRLPKRPQSSYMLFSQARWASGEFAGRPIPEAARAIAEQWKVLSETEKRVYEDLGKADYARYEREAHSVLGRAFRQE